jgi:hypothetical protein
MCKKVRFWVKKRAFSTILCTILHKNDLFFTDIAPRYRAASPSGKNPPIYTVLNAAFSAPGPPRLWHRGGTPVPDALARAPDARFGKIDKIDFFQNTMMGKEISLNINYGLLYEIFLNYNYFLEIFDSGESLRDANTYGLAPRSVVTNRPQNGGSMIPIHRKKNNS